MNLLHNLIVEIHLVEFYLITSPDSKSLNFSKLAVFENDKMNVFCRLQFVLGNGRKHFGKTRKCSLPEFSPSPKIFSKTSLEIGDA